MNVHDEPWQEVSQLVRSASPPNGLERLGCKRLTRISLVDALHKHSFVQSTDEQGSGKQLADLLARLESFSVSSRCPIVGIAGMLNAGKSSLVATYLSPENRQLVPRGLGNASGTHRFVLWLPTEWRDNGELLSSLMSYLGELFGSPPEMLSTDPARAAQQYSGQNEASNGEPSGCRTPLVAFDSGLNFLQLGLVDCPDIQSGHAPGASVVAGELAEARRVQLLSIGKMCSAFLVVCRLGSLHDERLEQVLLALRSAMPGVPRMLAVNRVKARYSPETIAEEARRLQDRFGLSDLYVAYDYRSALAGEAIPKYPASLRMIAEDEEHPIFFRVDGQTKRTGKQSVDYLQDLSRRLDVGALARESSRSLRLQLKTCASGLLSDLEKNRRENLDCLQDGWRAVADACFEFMAQRDAEGNLQRLRLQTSPAIVTQIAESLQRTAPAWMRFSLRIDRMARQLQTAVADTASRLRFLGSAGKSVARIAKRLRGGECGEVVTPDRMVAAIRRYDALSVFGEADDSQMRTSCDAAMRRFAKEDATELDSEQLDQWSREIWGKMTLKEKLWKGAQPLAMVTAPFLAVILIPFDAGGSAVLVFASTKELLAAAGLAALLGTSGTGRELLGTVHRETPWRQLSELFAVSCDSLGLERPEAKQMPELEYFGKTRKLLASDSHAELPEEPTVQLWQSSAEFESELRAAISRIEV